MCSDCVGRKQERIIYSYSFQPFTHVLPENIFSTRTDESIGEMFSSGFAFFEICAKRHVSGGNSGFHTDRFILNCYLTFF